MPDWAARVAATVGREFSDLRDVEEITRVALRLTVAALLGALLGYEREAKGKAAGIRTHMLVAIGAALFVLIPQQAGIASNDLTRVMQGVIAGIGFLGAGAILKRDGGDRNTGDAVHGLTTAASIWMTAAIGMAAGLGREATATVSAVIAFIILALVPHVLTRFERRGAARAGDDA